MSDRLLPASFRDPGGFMFTREDVLYRQINERSGRDYTRLMDSGLYAELVEAGLLVAHEEVDVAPACSENAYKVIRPDIVPFISYPYEWCFTALKRAAQATLRIHKRALKHDMILRDASAYNIQFVDAKPVFIDTLSFAPYIEGEPWVAYQQFCKHFLAPLALMAYRDIRYGQWLRGFVDGIPLDLASKQLPLRTRFNVGLQMHIHLHAKSQSRHADDAAKDAVATQKHTAQKKVSRIAMLGIIDSLQSTIKRLEWRPPGTEWGDYYSATNYTDKAMEAKHKLVTEFVEIAGPSSAWDLGANTGLFSRIASEKGIPTVAFDIDPVAVEKNYRACRKNDDRNMLPLLQDLTNPSPSIGWHNAERESLPERGPADLVMALALIHHLAISNNVSLPMLAKFFASVARTLIIEFVPKSDSQVRRLLATREDIFPSYTKEGFEDAFSTHFSIEERRPVEGSERTLYLLKRRD